MNFKEELKRFKPSMEVDEIEDAVMKMELTDMNDIMFQMMEKAVSEKNAEKHSREDVFN